MQMKQICLMKKVVFSIFLKIYIQFIYVSFNLMIIFLLLESHIP